MKSSHIGCDGYVEEENGIARIIGNVPIAHYDGSPRRYGAKPHVLATQQQQQQQQQQRHIHSTPGYPQRIINSVDLSVGLSDSTSESKGLADISCDEIVKSILSIPIAGEISPTDSNGSKSEFESSPISEHNSDNHDVNNMNIYHFSDLDYKLYAMNAKRVSSVSSSDDRCFDDSPTKSLNNDLLAHENELIILHESVRQHIFNEMVSVSVDREDVMTAHRTNTEAQTQVCDEAKNFTISPDITDCDSNEIESEISLEGSTVSNSKIMPHMPILEDGLSSGVPSSDNELEDDSNLYSVSFSRVKTKTYHNQHNQQDIVDTLEKNDCLNAILPNGSNYNQNKSESNSNSFHEEQNIDEPDGDKTINLNISEHPLKETNDVNERNTDQPISYESIWIPMSNDATTCATSTSIIEGDKTNCNLNSSHIPHHHDDECDTDQETDRLLGAQRNDDERGFFDEKERPDSSLGSMSSLFKLPKRNINSYVKLENFIDDQQNNANKRTNATREVLIREPSVLIEGVLFRARYLGSTQLICEGQPTKATRMMQAEEAVSRIKAPEGETQPSTDVDLFISTEKIMVLNTDLKEIMMDHALRTISYIADIGDLLVLMARRRILNNIEDSSDSNLKRIPKMICHVFESEEAQFIAQSIGQAFQVAYMEFLKANGIEDSSFVKEMDYQEVLNSQEIFGNELEMFAKKEKQKEVIVPKQKGEILGMVIVESGWGSMLPTVVIANMAQQSPSARCGQLNIGDQIIAINGVSLVGLPLSTCQAYIKNTKNQTVVKFTVVPCAPVVEVKIKRPDTKYQLGFSVQNGVICSLLRGGIAERGGVRVGHRIIEINGQSVVAVPHDRIVNLLATSVGEIHMKTMPTSMFRLLTGQESPTYM